MKDDDRDSLWTLIEAVVYTALGLGALWFVWHI